jgi:hypothetical protein
MRAKTLVELLFPPWPRALHSSRSVRTTFLRSWALAERRWQPLEKELLDGLD